jgi:hypothetical protein
MYAWLRISLAPGLEGPIRADTGHEVAEDPREVVVETGHAAQLRGDPRIVVEVLEWPHDPEAEREA